MKKKMAIAALVLMMAIIPVMGATPTVQNNQNPCEQMMNGNLPGMMNSSRRTGNVGTSGMNSDFGGYSLTGWFSLPF